MLCGISTEREDVICQEIWCLCAFRWIAFESHQRMDQCAISSGPIQPRILDKNAIAITFRKIRSVDAPSSTPMPRSALFYRPITSFASFVLMRHRMLGKVFFSLWNDAQRHANHVIIEVDLNWFCLFIYFFCKLAKMTAIGDWWIKRTKSQPPPHLIIRAVMSNLTDWQM